MPYSMRPSRCRHPSMKCLPLKSRPDGPNNDTQHCERRRRAARRDDDLQTFIPSAQSVKKQFGTVFFSAQPNKRAVL